MARNEDRSALTEIILISGIALFLFILSSQGNMNEIGINSDENINCELTQVAKSPDIKAHQGITTDGTYFYLFHTDFIKKTDGNWDKIDTNKNVLSEIGGEINHLGDGDYYDGKLYVPVEYWDNHDNFRFQHIAIWDATDLSYIGKHDISAQGHEIAGVVVDNNQVFVVSYYDGNKIWKYDLPDFTYTGHIPLSENIKNIQGITKKNDYFYISQESFLYKVSSTGTVMEKIPAEVNEGIDFSQEFLYCLNDEGRKEYIYTYKKSS